MSMSICRVCSKDIAGDVAFCPYCGIDTPDSYQFSIALASKEQRKKERREKEKFYTNIAWAILLIYLIGSGAMGNWFNRVAATFSDNTPSCESVRVFSVTDTTVIGESDFDYAYNLKASVSNKSKSGKTFDIVANLSTSQGLFTRTQKVYVEGNSHVNLEYTFEEPTIYVTNVQGSIACH